MARWIDASLAIDQIGKGGYKKPGAGPGSMMAAYAASARVTALTSTRIFTRRLSEGLCIRRRIFHAAWQC